MGYTHYWTQTRDFTREEWSQVREDMKALLKDVQHVQGIPLANGMGDLGTSPEISSPRRSATSPLSPIRYPTAWVRTGAGAISLKASRGNYALD